MARPGSDDASAPTAGIPHAVLCAAACGTSSGSTEGGHHPGDRPDLRVARQGARPLGQVLDSTRLCGRTPPAAAGWPVPRTAPCDRPVMSRRTTYSAITYPRAPTARTNRLNPQVYRIAILVRHGLAPPSAVDAERVRAGARDRRCERECGEDVTRYWITATCSHRHASVGWLHTSRSRVTCSHDSKRMNTSTGRTADRSSDCPDCPAGPGAVQDAVERRRLGSRPRRTRQDPVALRQGHGPVASQSTKISLLMVPTRAPERRTDQPRRGCRRPPRRGRRAAGDRGRRTCAPLPTHGGGVAGLVRERHPSSSGCGTGPVGSRSSRSAKSSGSANSDASQSCSPHQGLQQGTAGDVRLLLRDVFSTTDAPKECRHHGAARARRVLRDQRLPVANAVRPRQLRHVQR